MGDLRILSSVFFLLISTNASPQVKQSTDANAAANVATNQSVMPPTLPDVVYATKVLVVPFNAAGADVDGKALQCREEPSFRSYAATSEFVDALAGETELMFDSAVFLEGEGRHVRKFRGLELSGLWRQHSERQYASCLSKCALLPTQSRVVSLTFTSPEGTESCLRIVLTGKNTIDQAQENCGDSSQWREVIYRRTSHDESLVCATLRNSSAKPSTHRLDIEYHTLRRGPVTIAQHSKVSGSMTAPDAAFGGTVRTRGCPQEYISEPA